MDLNQIIQSANCKEDILKLRLFAVDASDDDIYLNDTILEDAVKDSLCSGGVHNTLENLFSLTKEDHYLQYFNQMTSLREYLHEVIEHWCEEVRTYRDGYTEDFLAGNIEVFLCATEANEEDFDYYVLTKFKIDAELEVTYCASEKGV